MSPASPVPPEAVQIAEDSYRRCGQDHFFPAFYQRLLKSHPAIAPKFAKTDFQKQHKLLQHGIGLLLIFAKRQNPALLERIAGRHAPHDLDIGPELYPFFVDSLLATVRQFDPQVNAEVEDAWRQALAPGIAFLIAARTPSVPGAGA